MQSSKNLVSGNTNDKREWHSELTVVMPVLNEQSCIAQVVNEWLVALRLSSINFKIMVLDNGSTDGTFEELQALSKINKELQIRRYPPVGHGQTCLAGYKMAILQGCTWVLQIDSDGQCDPQYFPQFWEAREKGICVQGVRTTREDGFIRLIASRLFSLVTYFISGVYIRDSNVPYRLMDSNVLSLVIQSVPEDFDLANIVVSYLFSTKFHIKWVPINFRERASGQSKRNTRKSIQVTLRYISQLQALLKGPTGLVANTCARLNGR